MLLCNDGDDDDDVDEEDDDDDDQEDEYVILIVKHCEFLEARYENENDNLVNMKIEQISRRS